MKKNSDEIDLWEEEPSEDWDARPNRQQRSGRKEVKKQVRREKRRERSREMRREKDREVRRSGLQRHRWEIHQGRSRREVVRSTGIR